MSDVMLMTESVDILDYWERVVGEPPDDTMIDAYTGGFLLKRRYPDSSTEVAQNFGLTVHARAAWARDGLATFRLSHSLLAALLMTDSDTVPLEQVQFPFHAFALQFPGPDYLFQIPEEPDEPARPVIGALVHVVRTARDPVDYHAVLQALRTGAEFTSVAPVTATDPEVVQAALRPARTRLTAAPQVRGLYLGLVLGPRTDPSARRHPLDTPVVSTHLEGRDDKITTVGSLLDSFKAGVSFRGEASKERGPKMLGMLHAVTRAVLNLALYVTNSEAPEPHGKPVRAAPVRSPAKHAGRVVTPRVWVVGNEIKLAKEVRDAARAATQEGHGRMPWRVSARFMVRGHFREQPYGPGRSLRRRQWIAPFWKGQESAVALARQYAVGDHEVEPQERPGKDGE